jgi:hypothetical protein
MFLQFSAALACSLQQVRWFNGVLVSESAALTGAR